MDSPMDDSVFDDYGDSDNFSPVAVPVSRVLVLPRRARIQSNSNQQCFSELFKRSEQVGASYLRLSSSNSLNNSAPGQL